jgi:hypothetical protein
MGEIKNKYASRAWNSEISKWERLNADDDAPVLDVYNEINLCKKQFSDSGDIMGKVEMRYKCELRKSIFSPNSHIEIHRRTRKKVYKCELCDKCFTE